MVTEAIAPSRPPAATRPLTVAVVGATGLVGRTMIAVLGERGFPVGDLRPLASRAEGRTVSLRRPRVAGRGRDPGRLRGRGRRHLLGGRRDSRVLAPEAARRGAVVIDNSSQWRMEPAVPLVVSQVNPDDAEAHEGIIANPNCSTMQLVPVLMALRDSVGLERVIVDTYQSVSGTGGEAVRELEEQTRAWVAGEPDRSHPCTPTRSRSTRCPQIDVFRDDGYTKEEWKVLAESRKILHLPDLRVSCTAVRVPVFSAHSEAVHVETRDPITPERARELFARGAGGRRRGRSAPAPSLSAGHRCGGQRRHLRRSGPLRHVAWTTAGASRSGSSRTTSARARPPTRSRSPRSCWSAAGWRRHRGGADRRRSDARPAGTSQGRPGTAAGRPVGPA